MKSRYSFEKDSMFSFDICHLTFVILILPPSNKLHYSRNLQKTLKQIIFNPV